LPHVRYQGKGMTLGERLQAVRTFQQHDKAMILLMSLKAGGVGLNLTRGNRKHSFRLYLSFETLTRLQVSSTWVRSKWPLRQRGHVLTFYEQIWRGTSRASTKVSRRTAVSPTVPLTLAQSSTACIV
jgi:hypothetical protein